MADRKQCAKCPWRKDVNPRDIPNGYCEHRHAALKDTIAEPGRLDVSSALRIMACHESRVGREKPCVGWVAHQLGRGNNIALRLAVIAGRVQRGRLVGEQHQRFEDTLPKRQRKARASLPEPSNG